VMTFHIRAMLGRMRAAIGVRRWPLLAPSGRARVAGLVLAALLFTGAGAQVGYGWATALPDNAVLRVGGTVISQAEFRHRVDVLRALYGLRPPQHGPKREKFDADAAKSIAVSLILERAAADRGIVIGNKRASDTLTRMIEEQLPNGRDGYVQYLSNQGIAEQDVIGEVKRQLATSALFQRITSSVKPVTGDEVRRVYQQRRDDMVRPERRHLRNIVVRSQVQARNILKKARAGTDFTKLAAHHSVDASTKRKGGDLGMLTADQLAKNYADAAFTVDKGSFFGPVKTRYGWNVGQVVGIEPAKQLSFNDVHTRLEAELNNKRKLDTWRTWLGNQITAADVEYADDYRPANPDAPPTGAPPR